nr:immunoglobulin gamma-1 heavy chain-like [Anolis sagrei ordinatus]
MSSPTILLCLLLALSIRGGSFQPVPTQLPQASFAEGATAILNCPLEKGRIQDYHVFWFQQKPSNAPAWVLKHSTDNRIDRGSQFGTRFVPIREAGANAYVLQIQGARTEDSAMYWCAAEINSFNTFVSGSGTQLSIRGGASVKAPASVTLLSDVSQTSNAPTVHALCAVEQFYPGILEMKWSMAGKEITDGVTPGQVVLNKDGSYSASSILNISRDLLSSGKPIKCIIHHESSGVEAEKSLEQCQGD